MKKWFFSFLFFFATLSFAEEITPKNIEQVPVQQEAAATKGQINLKEVFTASPIIYSVLILLSISSFAIWIQTIVSFRRKELMPSSFLKELRQSLNEKEFDQALQLCRAKKHLFATMMVPAIQLRTHGMQVMIDSLKAEGKRASHSFWQKLSLLNDITVIAPMLGLLGTVLGMFYAFYDINRSIESIASLFDGLGIAVGTTVVGLVVALLAMMLSTTLKHKLIKTLTVVENEALSAAHLIEPAFASSVEEKPKKILKRRKAE